MKPHVVAASCLVASLLVAAPAASQERPPEPRWGLDVLFGSAAIDPEHLNAFSRHRETLASPDPASLSRHYSAIYGPDTTVTASAEGRLPLLEGGWAVGVRATRRLGRRVTAVVGFDSLSRSRESSLNAAWQVTAYSPNAVAFPYTTGQSTELTVRLAAASYSPSAGIRWAVWTPRALRVEALVSGGPSYGTCAIEQRATQATPFYRQSSTTSGRMEGSGWHVAAEGGVRAAWSLTGRWGAAVEATYRYERFSNVAGTEQFASTRQDGDATDAESESKTSVSGRWRMVPYQGTLLGRPVNQPYPAVGAGEQPPFALDLSGLRLRAGVTVRFGAGGGRRAIRPAAPAAARWLAGSPPARGLARTDRLERPASALVAATQGARGATGERKAETVGDVVERASRWVEQYAKDLSLLVATEHYSQYMGDEGFARAYTRLLVSEFALVRVQDEWLGFRDVYEMDGKPVTDHGDRLRKLFLEAPETAVARAREITRESARLNLGAIQRNFNVPTMALFFLEGPNPKRFRFEKDGEETVDGHRLWKVRYEEAARPTIIRTSAGKDMPVTGRFWIDPSSGTVFKTHMEIKVEARMAGDPRATSVRVIKSSASITVTFKENAALGLLLPDKMLETYEGPSVNRFTGEEEISRVNCSATYSNFHRFETAGRVVVPK